MAAFIPPIPVGGQPVASPWGIDMHQRVYAPLTSIAAGNVMTAITGASRKVALDSHLGGYSMLDAANDQLVIPAGGAGLYLCTAAVRLNMATGSGNYMRFQFAVNGTGQNEGITVYGIGGGANWNSFSGIYSMSDGGSIAVNVVPHASVTGDVTMQRLFITRIANAYGTYVDPALEEGA